MAFCDTEGFLGIREENISNAEKIVGAYAPFFALKANTIAGVVFVVAASDIDAVGGGSFMASARFLQNYFDAGMIGENRKNLKKSILLLINKETGGQDSVVEKLALYIKESYKDYYKGLPKHNNKSKPNPSQEEFRVGQLKHFFSLFLEKDVQEHEMKRADFMSFLDKNKIKFFYPCKSSNVVQMRNNLAKLTPLDSSYLSFQDNRISQGLIQKIKHKAEEINDITSNVRRHQDLAENCLFEIEIKDDKLKELRTKKEKEKQKLEQKNKPLLSDTTLEKVYSERHVEDLPSSRTGGYWHYLCEEKNYSQLGSWFYSWFSSSEWEDYKSDGYLNKTFQYTVGEPIYKIEIDSRNGGNITWQSPSQNDITNDFDYDLNQGCYTPKSKKGMTYNQAWVIRHKTAYEKNARCYITFYSRKCDLSATQLKIQDNRAKIQEIEILLDKKKISNEEKKQELLEAMQNNQKQIKQYKRELLNLQPEMDMIVCWSDRIFRKDSSDQEFIKQSLQNYKIVCPGYMNSNINSKHSDYQPGGELEETKEDDCDNNNNNTSSSLSSSLLLGTGLLANNMSKKKN